MTQEFFPFYKYQSQKDAMKARNERLKELKNKGENVYGFSMPGQLHKYSGLGQPDGSVGTVYGIEFLPPGYQRRRR
jgi:hypothetical protein